MTSAQRIKQDYPWTQTPLIVSAPMRLIALADMAVAVSLVGGIGFIGAGTDISDVSSQLDAAKTLLSTTHSSQDRPSEFVLPIGIGFINWGCSILPSISLIRQYRPAAVWFFAPTSAASLAEWTRQTRNASSSTKIWIQVGSVTQALEALSMARPDVLVVQGTDAGGHGLARGAGVVTLVPEVCDAVRVFIDDENRMIRERNESSALNTSNETKEVYRDVPLMLAAGGIVEERGVAAALVLGADGVVMGTRFLASKEANIAPGYQREVLRVSDGGQTTVRTKVYDDIRGTTGWAETHNARGVINRSFEDSVAGMGEEENKRLYAEEMMKGDVGWGIEARMTTYAGSGVGLVREVKGSGEIVREVREGSMRRLRISYT